MADLKNFIKQHKLLTAGVVVGAILIGFGIGRAGQVKSAPEKGKGPPAMAVKLPPIPKFDAVPEFNEVYTPGEKIGLDCLIRYENQIHNVNLWQGEALSRINIDTNIKRWWASNTQSQTTHRTKDVWDIFDGRSSSINLDANQEFYFLKNIIETNSEGEEKSVFHLSINRINGEIRGRQQYDDGTIGLYGGKCSRSTFEVQPKKAF